MEKKKLTEAQRRRAQFARDIVDQEEEYRELQKAIDAERESRKNSDFGCFLMLLWLIASAALSLWGLFFLGD